MKKKIFLLPIVLLASLVFFNWGCGEEEKDEDLCQAFDISEIYPQCEIPTVCCPQDGSDCYFVNPNGENFVCNSANATDEDPDGCNDAENAYINAYCQTGKMSASDINGLKIELSKFTRQLMVQASIESICF